MNKKEHIFWQQVREVKKYLPLKMTFEEASKLSYIENVAWMQMLHEAEYLRKPKKQRDFEYKMFSLLIKKLGRNS